MVIVRYTSDCQQEWDEWVRESKNGTFLLMRGYMEYHSDRFTDCSFILRDDEGRLLTLIPGNISGDTWTSHGGLTYGGFVMDDRTSGRDPLGWFPLLVEQLKSLGVKRVVYKAIPHIYHRHPSEEDLYALFRIGARLSIRNLSTAIDLVDRIPSSRLGKRALKRARKGDIRVDEVGSCQSFWPIVVEDRRVRHNTHPVHTADELDYLKSRFPENIVFLTASGGNGDRLFGGAVLYIDRGVIHLQYAACTPEGKDLYATDVIYHDVIFNRFQGYRWFDFGISNEDAGRYLNEGMVAHKEEFGGRSICYDIYELSI